MKIKLLNIFLKKGITFEREKTFEDLIYKKRLRIDFYLPELNKAIEVDGAQHTKPIAFSKHSDPYKVLEENKIRDKIKNDYCKENNIPLLRIPYTHFIKTEKYKQDIDSFIS